MDLQVSVQANPRDRASWLQLAQTVEDVGFDALYVADHPGICASPFVALAAAAAVTERIGLGTCVVNAGVWEPMALANAVATLDVLSQGRAILGVGAGHAPAEWTAVGRSFPTAGARVTRLIELVEATRALLAGGPVTYDGHFFQLVAAELDEPRPLQEDIPLLIGGNGDRVLRFAGRHATVAGVTGAGRTLSDGHHHEVEWSRDQLDRKVELIRSAGQGSGNGCDIEALVQGVVITNDRVATARALADEISGASTEDLLGTPFIWIGTIDQIVDNLGRFEDSFGIARYVVRAADVSATRQVIDAIA